MPIEHHPSHVS
jgi:hypothetical protein